MRTIPSHYDSLLHILRILLLFKKRRKKKEKDILKSFERKPQGTLDPSYKLRRRASLAIKCRSEVISRFFFSFVEPDSY